MLVPETKPALAPGSACLSRRAASLWKDIAEPVRPFLEEVGKRLNEQIQAFDPEIAQYAQYALTNQGKQLRPVLVALSAGAAGEMNQALVSAAAIIEMVHLATLVHDDVVDAAEIRRGRPTLAANWGNQLSVLVGDCLFAHALELAAGFPTPEVCRAVAAATNTVCAGEILQNQHRRNAEISRAEYFKVLEMKTGELFGLSCDLGAALSGATAAHRKALRQYGLSLGTAYQIYDDCLDLFGSEAVVGKSLGTDLTNGKVTLPILVALENASLEDQAQLSEYVQNCDPVSVPRVLELLDRYDAQNEARLVTHEYLDKARRAVTLLPDSPSRAALIGLTHFLAKQTEALGVSS
jgi:octaprenyl-diphosphate synthase